MPGLKRLSKPPKRLTYREKVRSGLVKPWGSERAALNKVSKRRAEQLEEYLRRRPVFLLEDGNRTCPVEKALRGKTVETTDVHHMNGREGEKLLDESWWLGVSRWGHEWIHAHPREARERGWLV